MVRLTKKLLFAIEAVLDIAYNGGPVPVRSAEITERQQIPRRYLEPVLQEFVRNVQGLETTVDPISDPSGSALGHQVVRPLWIDLQAEMMRRLDGLSLEDLCSRAYGAGIAGRAAEGGEFDI